MSQSPFFMEVHANHMRNDVERSIARAETMKQLRAYRSSASSVNTPLVDRSLPVVDVAGVSRGLRLLVRGWTLALRGRAVA